MRITILTIFPGIFDSFLAESILGRAITNGLLQVEALNLRDYSDRKHRNTDDTPFGGGAGMVMLAQPIFDAMDAIAARASISRRIYLSPRGETLTQQKAEALAQLSHLVLLCGHYEGVDQRAIDHCVDEELSIGDYVLTGGEPAALVLMDCVARLIPGVLGCADSAGDESFTSGLLEYPHYTKPRVYRGYEVPEVLVGGHHDKIDAWRREEALRVTWARRPDLLRSADLSPKERRQIAQWDAEKDAAL